MMLAYHTKKSENLRIVLLVISTSSSTVSENRVQIE